MAADEISARIKIEGGKEAVKDLQAVAKEADKLDGTEVEVPIEADTKKARKEIESIDKLIEGLSDKDKTIVLKAQADQAEREIKRLTGQLGKAGTTETIKVKVDAIGNARDRLDTIHDEMDKIERDSPVDVKVKATGLDKVKDGLGDVTDQLGGIGSLLSSGGLGAAGIAGLATGALTLANNLADASLEVETLSRLTGDSMENASRLAAVWQSTGADVSDLSDVILQMNGVLQATPELAKQLGINLGDGASGGERLLQVIDLIRSGAITSVQASQLLGEEGVRQVAKLTAQYDDLRGAMAKVPASQVFTEEERQKLEDFTADMNNLKVIAAEVGTVIAERVIPVLDTLFGFIAKAHEEIAALDAETPAGARDAGLAPSDVFSGPLDVYKDFLFNWRNLRTGGHQKAIEDERAFWENVISIGAQGSDKAAEKAKGVTTGIFDQTQIDAEVSNYETSVEKIPAVWDAVVDGVQAKMQGLVPGPDAELAFDILRLKGLSAEEITKRAIGLLGDRRKAEKEAADAAVKDYADSTRAAEEYARQLVDAQVAVDDLASSFGQMEKRSDALSAIFDLKDAPLTMAGEVRDITQEIGKLSDAAKDIDLSKALDPSNVNADALLDAFDQLRPQLQQKVTETFSTDGAPAAKRLADSYVEQIFKELGGRLSRDEIRRLTGFDQVDVTLKLAVDGASLANAKAELDILTGVTGENTYTASIKLALATGSISPQAAQILINDALKDAGVKVPAALQVTGTPAAMAEAAKFARENPVPIASELNTPENIAAMASTVQILLNRFGVTLPMDADEQGAINGTMGARNAGQRTANDNPIVIPVFAASGSRGVVLPYDAGGTVKGAGLVAENGPEIVNGRYLVTSPTVVPGGTRVTSRRRTARILRTRGHRGLKRYDAGGTVVAGPQTLNVNVNATMVGNRFELARAVDKGTRDIRRLRGTRA